MPSQKDMEEAHCCLERWNFQASDRTWPRLSEVWVCNIFGNAYREIKKKYHEEIRKGRERAEGIVEIA